MSRGAWSASAILIVTIAAGSVARATEVKLWIAPTGGYSSYAMDQLNDRIEVFNQIYRPEFRLDHVDGGAAAGVEVGADIDATLVLAAGYEHLWAGSSVEGNECDVAADVFELIGGYRPFTRAKLRIGFDLGIGALVADGALRNTGSEEPLSGHCAVFDGTFVAEYLPWSRVGLMARIGYRSAVVDNSNEAVLGLPSNLVVDLDYSGLIARGGVRVVIW